MNVPLKTQFQVYTGNTYNEHYLTFGSTKIKIWGFQHDKYKRSRTESVKHDVKLFGFTLPIAYEKDIVREEGRGEPRIYRKTGNESSERNG